MTKNYQAPKVVRMTNMNKAKGDCRPSGSGDPDDCADPGMSAGAGCESPGNVPMAECNDPGNSPDN